MADIYRCGACTEDWPHTDDFKECPSCGAPCDGIVTEADGPDENEARTRAAHLRFNRYLRDETDEQRTERETNSPYRDKAFYDVIDGAGFQDWERNSIAQAEGGLKEEPSSSS